MEIARTIFHYGFHFLVPGLIAFVFYRAQWKKVWVLLLLTMLVDIDHLWATPIFDPTRCSINFHLFHSYPAICIYILLLFYKPLRVFGIGLCLHMLTDFIDCQWYKLLI